MPELSGNSIIYTDRCPEGLAGNGTHVLIVNSGGFRFHRGCDGEGSFFLTKPDGNTPLADLESAAEFFPGGVMYRLAGEGVEIEVLHASSDHCPYLAAFRITPREGGTLPVGEHDILLECGQAFEKVTASTEDGCKTVVFSLEQPAPNADWDALREAAESPSREGMVLRSPEPALDQAVAFSQYLLDLGYDGNLIVCELFRWRDIWSRDLGSGFVPGCIVTDRTESARKCIDVDIARHETAGPTALKTTPDASKGGTCEGLSLLTAAIWEYYLWTGDREYLERSAEAMRPWLEAWIDRDYRQRGLLIDVSEWMDHSRHSLLPYGSATLFSNALFVHCLGLFAQIEAELGHDAQADRWQHVQRRFIDGINRNLWSDDLGAYANLCVDAQRDERVAAAANALAILGGIASPDRVRSILQTLRERNWRPKGSMTITPMMTHVEETCDQNERMWPWWMAQEAKARFACDDAEGGLRILRNCADTIYCEPYPGMMEELLDRDGIPEGGHAFVTAAGAYIHAVFKGLFGIRITGAGLSELQITPNLPAGWEDCSLRVPTPGGGFTIHLTGGTLHVRVNDPAIRRVRVAEGAEVTGAEASTLLEAPQIVETADAEEIHPPECKPRQAMPVHITGLSPEKPELRQGLDLKGLCNLNVSPAETALIFMGNRLPLQGPDGRDLREILDTCLAAGGMLVFYGVSMLPRFGTKEKQMGCQSGIIEWYGQFEGTWKPVDPQTAEPIEAATREGTVYWGEGPYFQGWDATHGVFGFEAPVARGISAPAGSPFYDTPLPSVDPRAIFTDFAVRSPLLFHSLLETRTEFGFLYPDRGETFSCAARIVDRDTGGEIVMVDKVLAEAMDLRTFLSGLVISL